MKQPALTSPVSKFRSTFIGDRAFYNTVFVLVLPLIVQNAVTHFVNLLDNIMIGQVGTAQMSGVAIANQLIFVFNLTIFGGLSGAGIFSAQYYGAGDHEGLRHTVRFKLWTAALTFAVALAVFLSYGDPLISRFLTGDGDPAERIATLEYGRVYLRIMLWGLLPFSLSQVYGGTLREMGETRIPMRASVAGVFTNLCFNYLLIYGKLGFPVLGVAGAAIATVISRFVELAIMAVHVHRHTDKYPFVAGLYRSVRIPKALTACIIQKGMPLLVNELFWSLGMTTLTQVYSTRDLSVVAALNITSTVINVFNVVTFSMGNSVAVLVGQALGADDIKGAKQTAWRLMFFNVCACVVVSAILIASSSLFPMIYNTTAEVRMLAARFIQVNAFFLAFNAVTNSAYFTMRSGGKTFITFLFDSVFVWVVHFPITYALIHFTAMDILVLYPICQGTAVIKSILGIIVVKKGNWAQNMVSEKAVDSCLQLGPEVS